MLVHGDALKLREVVSNLLDNAVTYTPPGGTVLLIGRRDRGIVRLEVRDSGPGIAPEHLPRLFEPFYRVEDMRSRDTTHTGLGLALAAAVVHAHLGPIAVESNVRSGTTFTLSLPAVTG